VYFKTTHRQERVSGTYFSSAFPPHSPLSVLRLSRVLSRQAKAGAQALVSETTAVSFIFLASNEDTHRLHISLLVSWTICVLKLCIAGEIESLIA
jgi:hypothetical protein